MRRVGGRALDTCRQCPSRKTACQRDSVSIWARELGVVHGATVHFSHGWLEGFLDRHDLVLRKATNKPTHPDSVIVDRAAQFVAHLKNLIQVHNIEDCNIYSLDETSLFFDTNNDRTVERRGSTDVQVTIEY